MDAAVIFLDKPVNWNTNPNIRPICLPPGGKIEKFLEKQAMVTGWGLKGRTQGSASVLQKGPELANLSRLFLSHLPKTLVTEVKIMCFRKADFGCLQS
jgi:hypothetical protein